MPRPLADLWLVWTCSLILSGCAEARPPKSIGQLEDIVTLADVGFTTSSGLVRTSDGGFAAIGTYDRERVVRFDSVGSVVAATGRRGNGPGEYNEVTRLALGRADTLYLVDGTRVHIVAPDLSWVPTVAVPVTPAAIAVLSDGTIVGHAASSSGRNRPTLYRLHPDSASRVSWFAPADGDERFSAYRVLAEQGDLVWSVGMVTLDVDLFGADGRMHSSFAVEHPWFEEREPDGSARVLDVAVQRDGQLLLLVARERDDWEPPRTGAEGEDAAPVALGPSDVIARWEQRILLIDNAGEVRSTTGIPPGIGLRGFADAEHVYGFRSDEEVRFRVWRVRLDTPSE